jgi:Fungal specific transcription factor domain
VLQATSNEAAQPPKQSSVVTNSGSPFGASNSLVSPDVLFRIPSVNKNPPFATAPSPFSPSSAPPFKWPGESRHEVQLFHHYIVHCAPWVDICDPKSHFGKEVPKRAAQFPVIFNGMLAVAARHVHILHPEEHDESQQYVDECLRGLIVALEDPLAHWDENLLIAIILLRQHEEMGENDERCHYFGAARLLNCISSFAADGGLRESASWVSLRQHIYVSLTTQQPLQLSLENYRHSSAFRDFDDESWANRIIFCFANILKNVFAKDSMGYLSREKWTEINAEVDDWEGTKPWAFTPLLSDDFSEPDDRLGDAQWPGSWPELRTAHPAHAVGLQYFHLCKIMLAFYDPGVAKASLISHRSRILTDAKIRKHIRVIFGYAISNSHVSNAQFQASHILATCGAYLTDAQEQEAAIEYLRNVQRTMGWKTGAVIDDLRKEWQE